MWEAKKCYTENLDIQSVRLYVKAELFLKNELDLQSLGIKVFYSRTQTISDYVLPPWMVKIEKNVHPEIWCTSHGFILIKNFIAKDIELCIMIIIEFK